VLTAETIIQHANGILSFVNVNVVPTTTTTSANVRIVCNIAQRTFGFAWLCQTRPYTVQRMLSHYANAAHVGLGSFLCEYHRHILWLCLLTPCEAYGNTREDRTERNDDALID